jgi:hypothetical protein
MRSTHHYYSVSVGSFINDHIMDKMCSNQDENESRYITNHPNGALYGDLSKVPFAYIFHSIY